VTVIYTILATTEPLQ